MHRAILFKSLLMTIFLSTFSVNAAPFHGCTFLKERLIGSSWPGGLGTGCANFQVTYGACTKYHCTPFGCVAYPGTMVTGFLPDYIIEVTPYFGRSSFTDVLVKDPDGYKLAAQMKSAVSTWNARYPSPPSPPGMAFQNGYDETQENNAQVYHHSYFGRMLPTPNEDLIWKFQNMDNPAGKSIIGAITGFNAISEFDPETWNDGLLDPDKKISTPLIPATNLACHGAMSAAQGAIQSAKQVIANLPVPPYYPQGGGDVIAMPVSPASASYSNLKPDSDALSFTRDPTRMCMGKLGSLLPRSGHSTTTERYTASQIAAWRIASLSYDHFSAPFGTHAGGIMPDDKWQILWPPVMPTSTACFAPGGLNTPTLTINPVFEPLTHISQRAGIDTLVIGVWRKRARCVEPWDTASATAEFFGTYAAKVAACQLPNKLDLMP